MGGESGAAADMNAIILLHVACAVAALIAAGHVGGFLARRVRQPAVIGEIVAGFVIGRTGLWHAWPGIEDWLFPVGGPVGADLARLGQFALIAFMIAAGLEVRWSRMRGSLRASIPVAIAGFAVPFAIGAGAAWWAPAFFGVGAGDAGPAVFPMVLGSAFAMSALPVIARTLQELGLLALPFGATVMTAAIFQDVAGWLVFAAVLGLVVLPGTGASPEQVPGLPWVLLDMVLVIAVLFTVGRRVFAAVVGISRRGGPAAGTAVVAAIGTLGLMVAVITNAIGIHAAVGALLAGIAMSDTPALAEPPIAAAIGNAVAWCGRWVFPLFFVAIGLRVDAFVDGDPALDAAVIALACAGKCIGGGVGARLGGQAWREAWAVGAALNARGAMGIVIAQVAWNHQVISWRLFVALVAMAVATSVIAGPILRALLPGTRQQTKAPAV